MAFRDQPMRCPRCGPELARYDDREKWRCKACNGVLVGIAELEAEVGPLARAVLEGESDPARPALHPCPACAFPMTPYTVAAIELDRCVNDALVWFDGGELGRVRRTTASDDPVFGATIAFARETLGNLAPAPEFATSESPPELPHVAPLRISDEEWKRRRLCKRGECNGVLGSDGHCNACGRPGSDA